MSIHLTVVTGPHRDLCVTTAAPDILLIGRAPSAQLCLADDDECSRYHLLIEVSAQGATLQDLQSANGTSVNGEPITNREQPLRPGDCIRIGQSEIVIQFDDAPAVVPVVCRRCEQPASLWIRRSHQRAYVYLCPPCQSEIAQQPILHPEYEILRHLGSGQMGHVYLARHRNEGYLRALKMMLPTTMSGDLMRALFLREASVQTTLDHPHIVRADDLCEPQVGLFCLVMEYVDGPTLEQLLFEEGNPGLAPARAVELVCQALLGLDYLHGRTYVHRDIKDGNLLVERGSGSTRDIVKLADCGLAKCFLTAGLSSFTRTGDWAGTAEYMAPEQVLRYRDAGPAADLYSMGCVLYRLLSGVFPIDATGVTALTAVLERPPIPLRIHVPQISTKLEAVVMSALAKHPCDRPADAGTMHDELFKAL